MRASKEDNMANKTKKYQKEYEMFIKEQHICQCGCGTVLKPSYEVFYTSMKKYNMPPRYIHSHHPRKIDIKHKEIPDIIEYNGCKILLLKSSNRRCEKSYKCEKYLDCLNHIAMLDAEGWNAI
jgi:hypothetical protein